MPTYNIQLISAPGMEYADLPTSMWLPYSQFCGEIYRGAGCRFYRYTEVIIYSENDDCPEDDLISDCITVPKGYVAWAQASWGHYTSPLQIGDTLNIICPTTGEILFSETIAEQQKIDGEILSLAEIKSYDERFVTAYSSGAPARKTVSVADKKPAAPLAACVPERKNGKFVLKKGMRVKLSGDSSSFGIEDYNVRICSGATLLETPAPHAKKVLICIDSIDRDSNATVRAWCAQIQSALRKN